MGILDKQKKALFKLVLIIGMISYLAEGLLGPIYAIFVQKVGGQILDASGSQALFLLVYGVSIFLVARIKTAKEFLTLIGFSVMTISSLGFLMITQVWHLFAVQFFYAIGYALITPTWEALIYDFTEKEESVRHWSYSMGSEKIMLAISAMAGGILATIGGFGLLFIVMFLTQLFATTLFAGLIFKKLRLTHATKNS